MEKNNTTYDFDKIKENFINILLYDNNNNQYEYYKNEIFNNSTQKSDNKSIQMHNIRRIIDKFLDKILATNDGLINKIPEFEILKNRYIIINFLCYSDTKFKDKLEPLFKSNTYPNFDKINLDKIAQYLMDNKSIAIINKAETYDKAEEIENKIYNFVHIPRNTTKKDVSPDSNNDIFLLIWKFNMYRILNIYLYNAIRTKMIYIYLYILYRIFYYFINICSNLYNIDTSINKSLETLYSNKKVNNIIDKIKLWSQDNISNYNIYFNKDISNDNNIFNLCDEFFKDLIRNIFIIFKINPYNKNYINNDILISDINQYIEEKSTLNNNILTHKEDNNLIYDFFSLFSNDTVKYINEYENNDNHNDANEDNEAMLRYKIYKNICVYNNTEFSKIDEALNNSQEKADKARKTAEEEKKKQ